MAYQITGKSGIPITKDGEKVLGFDISIVKIEQLDDKNKTFLAIASTEDEDRDKDVIRIEGWDLKNFKKNPVIPWGHNYYEPPIGKAVSIKKDTEKKRLVFKPQFDTDDEKAMSIFNKYKNGYLTSFSAGFIGNEFKFRDEEDRWYGGREFIKQELLEISAVTVPANPKANIDMRGFNDGQKSLIQEGYKQYSFKSENGLFIPTAEIALFTNAKTIKMGRDVSVVLAGTFDNPMEQETVVGYIFDESFDEKQANEMVKKIGPEKYTKKYFDFKDFDKYASDEKIEFDLVEEEVKLFEEQKEEIKTEQKEEIKTEQKEEIKTEQKIENEEETEQKEEIKTEQKIENEEETEKKDLAYQEILDTLKILLEKFDKMDNSNMQDKGENNEGNTNNQNNDEFLEIDKSLFSPVEDNKSQDDFIELDEKSVSEIVDNLNVKDAFKSKIKDIFKQKMDEFSGKID